MIFTARLEDPFLGTTVPLHALGTFAFAAESAAPSGFRFCAGGRGGGGGRRGGGGGRLGTLRGAGRRVVDGPGGGGGRDRRGGCTIVVAVDMPEVETCEAVLESTIGGLD